MPTKILCLGDSLTEAYGVPSNKGWVYLLEQELRINIINAGISGDTTTGMLGRCESLLKEHQPTHLLILGGTNDILFGLKDEFIISNIHAMSRHAKFYDVECIVGIPTSIINENRFNFLKESVTERIINFQEVLIEYCKEDEKDVIDFSVYINPEHYLEDGVHLNESGHIEMKNVVSTLLPKVIN